MVKLSKRLLCAANEIGTVDSIADIGTDHGKLIQYALENGIAQRAFAVDISAKSLEKARKNLESNGWSEKVTFYCGDGLRPLGVYPDVVVIAGMGGNEIVKILSEGKQLKKAVLIPHQDAHVVRRYLVENGYKIEKDYVIKESKYYQIIVAVPGVSDYTAIELIVGKNIPPKKEFGDRIVDRYKQIETIMQEQGVIEERLQPELREEYKVLKIWLLK